MKQFFQNAFTKIKDYFTANQGRKIFFWGLVATILTLMIDCVCRVVLIFSTDGEMQYFLAQVIFVLRIAEAIALLVAGVGTLWDSMQSRYFFLKKMRDIQYEHLKSIYEKQTAGENVVMTATFSDEENRYLKRKKRAYVWTIIFKVFVVIALFSLLLGV